MCKPDWKFRAWVLPWEENHIAERHRALLEKWFTHGSELAPPAPRHSAHTHRHSLTQGNDKYYIFIKARRIYARKQFVAYVQNTEMLQSLKQTKGFFQGPIIPKSRTGHWAEQKPQTGLGDPIKQKHAAHTTEKGQGGGIEKRHFQRKTQKQLSEAFIFHNNTSPRVPAITARTPYDIALPPSLLQQSGKVGVGKEYALRQKLLQNTRISPEWLELLKKGQSVLYLEESK